MLILGLDPSLSCTGWGIVRSEGARLSHVANGQVATHPKAPIAERLHHLHEAIVAVIGQHAPDRAAVEEVFVNKNPQSTLKLAQARGAVLAACGHTSLSVAEHAARLVKKRWSEPGLPRRPRSRRCSRCFSPVQRSRAPTPRMRWRWRSPMHTWEGEADVPGRIPQP